MTETLASPYQLPAGEGCQLDTWFFGSVMRMLATGAHTGGAFALMEQHCRPGFENPLHVHHAEDEAFFVLEGTLELFVGESRLVAGPGSYVWGPREVPHGFRVHGDDPCRLLLLATPSGFDAFVAALGVPAAGPGFPPPGPPPMDALLAAADRHRIEILGPLPD